MPKLELTVGSTDALDVRRFVVTEALTRPFTADIWVRSRSVSIDLDAIVGQSATFQCESDHPAAALGGLRELVGRVLFMRLVQAEPEGLSTYQLRIVAPIELLRLRKNLRLFQDASLPTMVARVLGEWKIDHAWRMDTTPYPVVDLRTQYDETDFAFVHRLLEEAGISYTFEQKDDGRTELVLSDAFAAGEARPGPIPYLAKPTPKESREYVTAVRVVRRHRPTKVTLSDYDFGRPDLPLRAASGEDGRCEWHEYEPHRALSLGETKGDTPVADVRGAYRHQGATLASDAARTLGALRSDVAEVRFDIATIDMQPGMTFEVGDHPELAGQRLLCTEVTFEGSADGAWSTSGRAVSASEPYRPPRRIEKPRAVGFVSATVVGPDKHEILVDEHGRVRVQLPWDRESKGDERSSCWLRVSQTWAGAAYGAIFWPRIGQEVLVAFLNGNPDAPVVAGRVHNLGQPAPFRLPGHAARSVMRTSTSPGGAGWNEVVLDDSAGDELLFIQAEKNSRTLVLRDATLTTKGRRTLQIGTNETEVTLGDRTQETRSNRVELTSLARTEETEGDRSHRVRKDSFDRIEQDRVETVIGSAHARIRGARLERVVADDNLSVGSKLERHGSTSRSVGTSIDISCGSDGKFLVRAADVHIVAKDVIAMEAGDICLNGDGGFFRADAGGVTIVGTQVKINAGGSPGVGPGTALTKALAPLEALVEAPEKPAALPAGGLGAEMPKGPEPFVTVRIMGATGAEPACPLIPKGKTHAFTAVGTPDGGKYKWTAKGGATIKGDATAETVVVSGATVSAAVGAGEIEVEYTVPDGSAKDEKRITVFELTEIEARLSPTRCLRTKAARPMAAKSSRKNVKTFDASAVTAIRGSGELELDAITKPQGVPVTWFVERAADDAESLVGEPTHAQGSGTGRRLRLDATGSFHVHGFVDCDGDGKRGDDETGLILNVNIVEVSVVPGAKNNRQFLRQNRYGSARSIATHLIVDSGTGVAPAGAYGDDVFLTHAQSAKVIVDLRGGGADGRRGVREVGLGFLQTSTADTFKGTYADGRTAREVIVPDATTPDPITGGAWRTMPFPIRDHRGNDRAGYDVFINGSSDHQRKNLPEGGQRRTVRMVDSPAVVLPLAHPVTGSALASLSGANYFKIMLCVFTADYRENFSTLASGTWKATYGTYTGAGGWTNARARVTGDRVLRVHHPPERSEKTPAFERCPPGFTDRLRTDCR